MSRIGSLVSAVVFTFNGFLIDYHDVLDGLATMVWLPFILFYMERALKQKRRINLYSITAGLIYGIQFLGGHFQFSYYITGIIIFYFFWRLFEGRTSFKNKSIILVIILSIGLGIAAVQLLPSYELTKFTARETIKYSKGIFPGTDKLDLFKLFSFVFSHFNGIGRYSHFQPFYIGLIPISLGILGIAKSDFRKTGVFLFLCVISITIAAGNNLPFFKIFYNFLPGFSLFRDPLKILYIFVFGISVLSGIGADKLSNDRNIFSVIVITLSLFFLIPAYLTLGSFGKIFIGMPEHLLHYLEKNAAGDLFYFAASITFFIFMYKLIAISGRFKRKISGGFLVVYVFLDMFVNTNSLKLSMDKAKAQSKLPVVSFLQKNIGLARIYSYSENRRLSDFSDSAFYHGNNLADNLIFADMCLAGNSFVSHSLSSFSGYSSLPPRRLLEYSRASLNIEPFRKTAYPDFLIYPNFLRLSNIKYIVMNKNADDLYFSRSNSFKKVYEDASNKIYLYKGCFPRAIFVSGFVLIKDARKILNRLKSDVFAPQETVIIEDAVPYHSYPQKPYKLTIDKYEADRIVATVKVYNPGFFVLLDSYYPGWHAYVDGRPAKIYRADYLFRGVYIPKKGNHKVVFLYKPKSFFVGAGISITTFFCCICGLWGVKRNRQLL